MIATLLSGEYTDLIVASDINLSSVPTGATIYGLRPSWEGYRVGEDQIREYVFQFVDDTGRARRPQRRLR
jgi:hypothetical protein